MWKKNALPEPISEMSSDMVLHLFAIDDEMESEEDEPKVDKDNQK